MKKFFLFCVSWICTFASVQADVKENEKVSIVQVYYKNQSYSQFVEANKENARALEKIQNPQDKQHVLNLANIFMAQVLKSHPKYLEAYAKNYAKLSFYEKAIFLRGMHSAGIEHDLITNNKDKKIQKIIHSRDFTCLSDIDSLEVKQAKDLDILWGSFFATGKQQYIQKILEVLHQDDEALFIAYEIMNREYIATMVSKTTKKKITPRVEDIEAMIRKREAQNPGFKNTVMVSSAAFWSLESNSMQDKKIQAIIQSLIKEHPELDYWKKIDKILNNK